MWWSEIERTTLTRSTYTSIATLKSLQRYLIRVTRLPLLKSPWWFFTLSPEINLYSLKSASRHTHLSLPPWPLLLSYFLERAYPNRTRAEIIGPSWIPPKGTTNYLRTACTFGVTTKIIEGISVLGYGGAGASYLCSMSSDSCSLLGTNDGTLPLLEVCFLRNIITKEGTIRFLEIDG